MVFGAKEKKGKQPVRTSSRTAAEIETVLGPNTSIKGDIASSGGVRVDGDLEGTVNIDGNLIVGEAAKVVATISAHNVQIQGTVQGDVTARRLEVLDTGKLWGNITVDSFVLDDGGFFSGQSAMQSEATPPLLEASSAESGDIVDVQATIAE